MNNLSKIHIREGCSQIPGQQQMEKQRHGATAAPFLKRRRTQENLQNSNTSSQLSLVGSYSILLDKCPLPFIQTLRNFSSLPKHKIALIMEQVHASHDLAQTTPSELRRKQPCWTYVEVKLWFSALFNPSPSIITHLFIWSNNSFNRFLKIKTSRDKENHTTSHQLPSISAQLLTTSHTKHFLMSAGDKKQ